ncbi:hypothetical protein [Modestobacter versicolor]|uniref:hypothetical protein n=1 Tax=Modestobacter versicolor TaxID=429133 RepID=UPI0034DEB111
MSARRLRPAVVGLALAVLAVGGPVAGAAPALAGPADARTTAADGDGTRTGGDHDRATSGGASTAAEVPATATISEPYPLGGDPVTVTGNGFAPGEEVDASLPSRTRGQLGSAVADAEGQVSIAFSVPLALPVGDQEVRLTGTSGETASTGFQLRTALEELRERLLRWWQD